MDINQILISSRSPDSGTRKNGEKALSSLVLDKNHIAEFFNYIINNNNDINNKKLYFVFIKNYISDYMVS